MKFLKEWWPALVLLVWTSCLPFLNAYINGSEPQRPNNEHAQGIGEAEPQNSSSWPFVIQVVPAPKTAKERAEEAEDRAEKKSADAALVRWTFWLFFATVGLIGATGVLGYFALRQARDMKESIAAANKSADASLRSAKVAESNLRDIERAFVSASDFTLGRHDPKGDFLTSCVWINTGRTATKFGMSHMSWELFPAGIPREFTFPDYGDPPDLSFIGPNGRAHGGPMQIPQQFIISALQGMGRLYLWGWYEYDDIFEGTKRHGSEFCVRLLPSQTIVTADGQHSTSGVFRFHNKHNGADEDCTKPIQTGSPKNPLPAA